MLSERVWSLLWKARRSYATADAAAGTHRCGLTLAVAAAHARRGWLVAGEGSGTRLTHGSHGLCVSPSLIGFLYSPSPACDKDFQIPYFLLLLPSMQSLGTQIWGT